MKLTKTSAFTLMEILLATTIFAGAMLLAAGAFSGGIKSQIKAVRERKIAQEARLFEEVFARKIREATGEVEYYPPSGEKRIIKGAIAVNTNNYLPKKDSKEADVLILAKPDGPEILKVVEEGRGIYKIRSKQFPPEKKGLDRDDIRNFEESNPTIFPQESYLRTDKPFRTKTELLGDTFQKSLITFFAELSSSSTQCVNNNRDACMNIETQISTREGIKL